MKLSEVIRQLQANMEKTGDADVSVEVNDGHATWASKNLSIKLAFREIWKGNPSDGKRWFLDISGGY